MSDWREVDIKVFLHPNSDPPFHLECADLPKGPHPNHFVFNNEGHEGFLLYYKLQEPTHGYLFPDDKEEALYSAKGPGCPKIKDQWGQFKAREVWPNNKVLVVRNMNRKGHEGEFGYTLRVTTKPHDDVNAEYLELDPGGTNNNGHSRFEVNYLKVAAIGVTTGILGAVATTAALAKFNLVCPQGF